MYDNYNYYSTSSSTPPDPAVVFAVFLVVGIICLITYVVFALFLAMVFKKAGIEGWKAWVPIYNTWVMLEMGGQPGWIALLSLAAIIPFIGWIGGVVAAVFVAIAMYHIGMKFGKPDVFVLLGIFLPLVWVIWLAVDKSAVWNDKQNVQAVPAGPATVSAPAHEKKRASSKPKASE